MGLTKGIGSAAQVYGMIIEYMIALVPYQNQSTVHIWLSIIIFWAIVRIQ